MGDFVRLLGIRAAGFPRVRWRRCPPADGPARRHSGGDLAGGEFALTYIGNAPNLMIYAMAVERGIAMPSFFAFMGWSGAVLLPAFALVGWLYFS